MRSQVFCPSASTGAEWPPCPDFESDLLTRLDPRAPLVLDTRELGRRPGSQRQVSRIEPAPAGLNVDMLGVPPGSDLELELRLEAVMEGVLVTGTVRAQATGECARCLGPFDDSVVVDVQELFVYDRSADDDDEVSRLEEDLLDLEPLVRDAVVLALPFNPLCEPDCPGLCPTCGARLADDSLHGHDEQIDPRWTALSQLAVPMDERRPAHLAGPDEE